MRIVLLPPGGYPISVKYIISYHKKLHRTPERFKTWSLYKGNLLSSRSCTSIFLPTGTQENICARFVQQVAHKCSRRLPDENTSRTQHLKVIR